MPKDGYATDIGVGGTRTATASPALSRSATGRSGEPSARVHPFLVEGLARWGEDSDCDGLRPAADVWSPCHARKGRGPEWGRYHPHGAEDAWQTAFAFSETNLTR